MLAVGSSLLASPAAGQPDDAPDVAPAVLETLPNLVTRMTAPVDINGAARTRFVVDTGANRTGVSQEFADRLNLPPGPMVLVNGVSAAVETPTVRIERLSVGRLLFNNLVAPVFSSQRLGADGLLGVDVLGQFAITFDVQSNQLHMHRRAFTLGRGRGSRLAPEATLAARQSFGQLSLIDVSADGVAVRAFIDSGSQYSIGNTALYRSVAAQRPGIGERRWPVPVIGTVGDPVMGQLAVLENVRFGPFVLASLPSIFCDLHIFQLWDMQNEPAMIFGADILRLFESVTVDFLHEQVRFGRPVLTGRRRA